MSSNKQPVSGKNWQESPALPNSFDDGKKPNDDRAPGGIANPVDSHNRGKDGTSK